MTFSNQLTRLIDRLKPLPEAMKWRAFSFAFGRVVPFVSTAGVRIHSVSETEVELSIKNRRRARNHVGGVHAAAIALLAETASGVIVARNVPDNALPLIKTMNFDFVKRNQGDFRARATLSPEQVDKIRTTPKGETTVPVTLMDATGGEPIRCRMDWAWVPKKKARA